MVIAIIVAFVMIGFLGYSNWLMGMDIIHTLDPAIRNLERQVEELQNRRGGNETNHSQQ